MNKVVKDLFTPKKSKFFWGYFVASVILLVLGVWLLPVWSTVNVFWSDWATKVVNIFIGVALLAYIVFYLIKKTARRGNGVVKTLLIIEMILMVIICAGCFIQQFKSIIAVNGACVICGLALWCRGVIEVFIAYFHQRDSKEKYTLSRVFIALVLVTLGTYLFAKPLFQDVVISWIFAVCMIVVALVFIYIGIKSKPAGKPKAKKAKKESK